MYGHHIGLQRRVEIVLEKCENLKEQKVGAEVAACQHLQCGNQEICVGQVSHLDAAGIANSFGKCEKLKGTRQEQQPGGMQEMCGHHVISWDCRL